MSSHDGFIKKKIKHFTCDEGKPLGGKGTESTPPDESRSDLAWELFFLGKIVISKELKSKPDS